MAIDKALLDSIDAWADQWEHRLSNAELAEKHKTACPGCTWGTLILAEFPSRERVCDECGHKELIPPGIEPAKLAAINAATLDELTDGTWRKHIWEWRAV